MKSTMVNRDFSFFTIFSRGENTIMRNKRVYNGASTRKCCKDALFFGKKFQRKILSSTMGFSDFSKKKSDPDHENIYNFL